MGEGEGIPVHLDFGHDLIALETGLGSLRRPRLFRLHARRGRLHVELRDRGRPGKKTRPIRHLYEAFFYVLTGHGSTTVWLPNGENRSFEWGPRALFAIPLNCQYQIFNNSGVEPARVSCTHDGPITINLYHNLDFVFDNPFAFPDRTGGTKHFDGEGDHRSYVTPMDNKNRNVWETNFVHDLMSFKLYELEARGKGSTNVSFVLADGTMHAHCSQIPAGRYKKAHRHAAGTHVHAVDGEGYSLLWYEGNSQFKEFPWKHGFMYTPPFWMFHQHFNTCPKPARYLACSLGSRRYPFIALRRKSSEGGGAVSCSRAAGRSNTKTRIRASTANGWKP